MVRGRHLISLSAAICLAMLAGCATYSPFFILEESRLKRTLPPDIAMSDYVETDWFGSKVTVAEKLARLGAYTEGDKIRDGTGQEIRFIKHEERSLKASPEALKQEQDKTAALKKYFTVIEVRPDPGPALPAVPSVSSAPAAKSAALPPPALGPAPAPPQAPSSAGQGGTPPAGWLSAAPAPPTSAPAAIPSSTTQVVPPAGWQPNKSGG
jgi:hypothetical protein